MNLKPTQQIPLKVLSLFSQATLGAMFWLIHSYQVMPTGLLTALPPLYWAAICAVFAAFRVVTIKDRPIRWADRIAAALGLWVWSILFTAQIAQYGVSVLVLPYTLGIILEAVLLSCSFAAHTKAQ